MRYNPASNCLFTGLWIIWFILAGSFSARTQAPGLTISTDESSQGYIVLAEADSLYIIDECGTVQWKRPFVSGIFNPTITPDGNIEIVAQGELVRLNAEGEELFRINNPSNLQHEMITLPNGNILTIAETIATAEHFDSIGLSTNISLHYSHLLEIDPLTEQIVWEWNPLDHMIQDRDSSRLNYGDPTEHPELLDPYQLLSDGPRAVFMINGIDYHEDLDQILISLRTMQEIVIVDHSTSLEESQGHTGGRSGRGGDLLYRWGRNENYGYDEPERELYFQHAPRWIDTGIYQDKIIVFNNGLLRQTTEYSSVLIIDPPIDESGNYLRAVDRPFGPEAPDYIYVDPVDSTRFYSAYVSMASVMNNGNIYIMSGYENSVRCFEINDQNEIVWEYSPKNQWEYRIEKYPADYSGFASFSFSDQGRFFQTAEGVECQLITSLMPEGPSAAQLWSVGASIYWESPGNRATRLRLYDIQGRMLQEREIAGLASVALDIDTGIYIVVLQLSTGHQIVERLSIP